MTSSRSHNLCHPERPRLLELPTVPTLTGFSNLHHNLQAAQLTERDLAHKLESVRKSVAYYKVLLSSASPVACEQHLIC